MKIITFGKDFANGKKDPVDIKLLEEWNRMSYKLNQHMDDVLMDNTDMKFSRTELGFDLSSYLHQMKSGTDFHLITEGAEVVGCGAVVKPLITPACFTDLPTNWVTSVYIDAPYRHKTYGRKYLKYVKEQYDEFALISNVYNPYTTKFYSKFGMNNILSSWYSGQVNKSGLSLKERLLEKTLLADDIVKCKDSIEQYFKDMKVSKTSIENIKHAFMKRLKDRKEILFKGLGCILGLTIINSMNVEWVIYHHDHNVGVDILTLKEQMISTLDIMGETGNHTLTCLPGDIDIGKEYQELNRVFYYE